MSSYSSFGGSAHRFVRNTNYASTNVNRVANRFKPFENTLTVLNDPNSKKKLFLIGTTNSSTLLSYRTQKLILDEKPDTVYVQTNQEWADMAQAIKGITTQSQFDNYNSVLRKANKLYFEANIRGQYFKAKFYTWLFVMNWIKSFPADFHPFTPGLEMKLAVEAAKQVNSKVVYGGFELNDETLQSLQYEQQIFILPLLYRQAFSLNNNLWKGELQDNYNILKSHGGEAFAESLDKYRLNWFIKLFEKYAPNQKKIFIDKKDRDIFYELFRDVKGEKVVAVVNQWHVPGIEAHWKHSTGQDKEDLKFINPIGDMDIDLYQEQQLVNNKLRTLTSRLTKSEPASWQNYITQYHKDGMEPERTRHVSFLSSKDDQMHHGLPSDHHDKDHIKIVWEEPNVKYPAHHHDHHDDHHHSGHEGQEHHHVENHDKKKH